MKSTDINQITSLLQQMQSVTQAIAVLEAGGMISGVSFSPPPMSPENTGMQMPMMGAMVSIPLDAPLRELAAEVRKYLDMRHGELTNELAALGVA